MLKSFVLIWVITYADHITSGSAYFDSQTACEAAVAKLTAPLGIASRSTVTCVEDILELEGR